MDFNEWLYEACEIKSKIFQSKTPHDIFQYVDLTKAKLSFVDGDSHEEFSKQIEL